MFASKIRFQPACKKTLARPSQPDHIRAKPTRSLVVRPVDRIWWLAEDVPEQIVRRNQEATSMDEIVPVALGVLLGALIWSVASGPVRLLLSVCAVAVSGLAATVLSGEYQESWIYLLLDLGEAALGLAAGMVIVHRVQQRRATAAAARVNAMPATERQP